MGRELVMLWMTSARSHQSTIGYQYFIQVSSGILLSPLLLYYSSDSIDMADHVLALNDIYTDLDASLGFGGQRTLTFPLYQVTWIILSRFPC